MKDKLKQEAAKAAPKTSKKQAKKHATPFTDPDRVAYMLSWRDRLIENQREQLAAYQELTTLMEALLAFSLFRIAKPRENSQSFCVEIPKEELRAMLSHWSCEVSDGEGAYAVHFVGKECEEHAKESVEG